MTENFKAMRKRHKQEIEDLQNNCKHTNISGWMGEYWAPGHGTGKEVTICKHCGKIIETKKAILNMPVIMTSNADGVFIVDMEEK